MSPTGILAKHAMILREKSGFGKDSQVSVGHNISIATIQSMLTYLSRQRIAGDLALTSDLWRGACSFG